jgi:hypothetical protein
MKHYNDLRDILTKIQFVIYDNKDFPAEVNVADVVDYRIFDSFKENYDSINYQVYELKQLIEKFLLCKNGAERLEFFLNNIYRPEQKVEEEII